MVRRTIFEKDGAQRITVRTDALGTQVIDENDIVLTTYGADRHDAAVENYVRGGWEVIEDA